LVVQADRWIVDQPVFIAFFEFVNFLLSRHDVIPIAPWVTA